MYRIILTSLALFTVITINSCAQQKNLVQNPNFTVKESFFSSWVAGEADKNSGMEVGFTVNNLPQNITLDSVFFKGQFAPVISGNQENEYLAHFVSEKEKDMVISSDMSKEIDNPKPRIPKTAPVEIKPDEALLIYTKNGKKQYHKITSLKDKGTKYPAEAPFNNR